MQRISILIFACLLFGHAWSQNSLDTILYKKFIQCKVDEGRYLSGWLGEISSGVPCFRSYTKNKFQTRLVDPKTDSVIYRSIDPEITGLKIIPLYVILDKKSRLFELGGQITCAWEGVTVGEFVIYIGHRHDTISNITLSPNLHSTVFYNGTKIDSAIIVDQVPAFYLTGFKRIKVFSGKNDLPDSKEMIFNMSEVIDDKSILVFALSSRYAEIFEVGKLLHP